VGKEDPVEFDSNLLSCSDMKGVAKVGDFQVFSFHFRKRREKALYLLKVFSTFDFKNEGFFWKLTVKYHYFQGHFTSPCAEETMSLLLSFGSEEYL